MKTLTINSVLFDSNDATEKQHVFVHDCYLYLLYLRIEWVKQRIDTNT